MSALSDVRFEALRTLLFTGGTGEMILQWLQDNGATSDCVPDAWKEMLDLELTKLVLVPTGQRSDDWFALLRGLTHTGSMNDMELQFWEAGGTFPP